MSASARVEITEDHAAAVVKSLHKLLGYEVLIGIPEAGPGREDEPVKNSELGFIHEFGSPANNIPARPFLIPGVEKIKPQAIAQLQKASEAALNADDGKAQKYMLAAGAIGMNGAKAQISSNIPPPLKPGTIRSRKYGRGTQSRRPEEERYLEMTKAGMDPGVAQSTAGIVTLINTGQLRNSITYVLGNKGK